LANYKPDLLEYYWQVERPSFVDRSTLEDVQAFEASWKALAKHVTSPQSPALAS
jgi:hypothetical protein